MKNVLNPDVQLREALIKLNSLIKGRGISTLFVVDSDLRLIGTITDGDIRRAILSGSNLECSVSEVMQKDYSFIIKNSFEIGDIDIIKSKNIQFLPVLDNERRIIKIINLKEIKTILPLSAVIIAGGEGKRLMPLTKDTPKPLLKVGTKPIIEHNIDRLIYFGIDNVCISINYLGHQIVEYFGNGKAKGINISYVNEDKPLGTIGSITLNKNIETEYVLITNSDLLTNIDYEDMFKTFISTNADLIVATTPFKVNVPYGIMHITEEERIVGLSEKPTYTYYSNAGIYIIKREHLKHIPENGYFNATDLIEVMINLNYKVVNYKIRSYWLDIGMMEDYRKAQDDIMHISLK